MSRLVPKLRFDGFSGEWEEKQLKNVTSAIFDGTHQTPKYTDKGIPFFSVENLISGKKNKFISIDDYKESTKKNKPEKDDILITRIGNI
ncbi:Type I restriction-modification system, specificity subunit S [hydrothermal vent metagenome]|uniref:Type I restriction-modification system, specificity subunit S n=1 Tax=hydrothermal vent metagenome TaxID=652676 RepID=A0A3B1DTC1_9ZZZZ